VGPWLLTDRCSALEHLPGTGGFSEFSAKQGKSLDKKPLRGLFFRGTTANWSFFAPWSDIVQLCILSIHTGDLRQFFRMRFMSVQFISIMFLFTTRF
jgi:hypothetical protein